MSHICWSNCGRDFYVGAKDVADTGYEFRGNVTDADIRMPRRAGLSEGTLIHIDEVKPANLGSVEVRVPIGRHNGSDNMLIWAKFPPGASREKHRCENCEMVYYVIRGRGMAGAGPDRVEVRAGHVHLIPRGVEHFLFNLSATEPLEVLVVYTGAGSVEEAGYIATGEVTEADKRARTAT